jgi:integrase
VIFWECKSRCKKGSELKAKRPRYQQGTIRKVERANGFAWEVRFSETDKGQRKQKSLYFPSDEYPTEGSVRRAIQQQVTLANSGSERAKVGAKFSSVITLYRSQHLHTLRNSTQQKNEYLLKTHIEPHWADFPLHEVTPLRVAGWLGGLKRVEGEKSLGLAATTKAGIRSVMSQCFELAALHGYIPATERNPMSRVRVKGTTKRERPIVILTADQFKSLVSALPSPVNVMALVAGCLGLRVGELVALHWSDIDWEDKSITIQRSYTHEQLEETKTESSNAVLPLDDSLLAILKAHKETTGESELLFPSPRNGSYRSASMLLQKGIQPVAERLGLGRVTWHGLRHSCRTWLDAKGVPVGLQKDLLRHADVSTTMNRYGRALQPDMRLSHSAIVQELIPDSLKG